MTKAADNKFKDVIAQLRKLGLLLESDAAFPNVCTLITGERMRGSWWSHPLAQIIFNVNERLEDHSDVLMSKLLSGKVTFVHRKLWPELFAIARAGQSWQTRGLNDASRQLMKLVKKAGSVRTDQISAKEINSSARELERKLLIYSHQFHTESGKHAKVLETWEHCAERVGFDGSEMPDAMDRLEAVVNELNQKFNANATLPWAKQGRRK